MRSTPAFHALALITACFLGSLAPSAIGDEVDAMATLQKAREERERTRPAREKAAKEAAEAQAQEDARIKAETEARAKAASPVEQPRRVLEDVSPAVAIPEAAVAAYAKGYLKARDFYAHKARIDIDEAKKKQKAAELRNSRERADAKAAATKELKQAEQLLNDILEHRKPLRFESMEGAHGLLSVNQRLTCIQKINEKEAIMDLVGYEAPAVVRGAPDIHNNATYDVQGGGATHWLFYANGIDTANFVDDAAIPEAVAINTEQVLLLEGTKTYNTLAGRRTVPLATAFNVKDVHAAAMKRLRTEKKI